MGPAASRDKTKKTAAGFTGNATAPTSTAALAPMLTASSTEISEEDGSACITKIHLTAQRSETAPFPVVGLRKRMTVICHCWDVMGPAASRDKTKKTAAGFTGNATAPTSTAALAPMLTASSTEISEEDGSACITKIQLTAQRSET